MIWKHTDTTWQNIVLWWNRITYTALSWYDWPRVKYGWVKHICPQPLPKSTQSVLTHGSPTPIASSLRSLKFCNGPFATQQRTWWSKWPVPMWKLHEPTSEIIRVFEQHSLLLGDCLGIFCRMLLQPQLALLVTNLCLSSIVLSSTLPSTALESSRFSASWQLTSFRQ